MKETHEHENKGSQGDGEIRQARQSKTGRSLSYSVVTLTIVIGGELSLVNSSAIALNLAENKTENRPLS